MFQLAIIIGIYAYSIFFLGIMHVLYRINVIAITVVFITAIVVIFRKNLYRAFVQFAKELKCVRENPLTVILLVIFIIQGIVNLIGALGPELAFDALWYHLTLPKLYLQNHALIHINGGLLYYSDMPKLGELLYMGALSIGNEITAKVFHLIFGVLTSFVVYRICRSFFNPTMAIIALVIYYANLVIAWESITAYIDLIRAFFEVSALGAFIQWWRLKENRFLWITATLVGLAISSKLLAIASLIIFLVLITWRTFKDRESISEILVKSFTFIFISLLIPLPWFIFAYINTGNPVYPLFSDFFAGVNTKVFDLDLLNPLQFVASVWNIFTQASDPLNPLYIIFLPLMIAFYRSIHKELKVLYGYSFLALCLWYVTSQVEGSRLLVPYLPAFSILCVAVLDSIKKDKKIFGENFSKVLIAVILLVSVSTIGYRFVANYKYIPVIIGAQSKEDFLKNNLNFSFGDFYDIDNFFEHTVKPTDKVLVYGMHNLYYVNFPYVHESWIQPGDKFNFIAIQSGELPQRFKKWQLFYENKTTHVRVYVDGGKVWSF